MKRLHVELGADPFETEASELPQKPGEYEVRVDGQTHAVRVLRAGSDALVLLGKRVLSLRVLQKPARERQVLLANVWQHALVGPPGAREGARNGSRDATLSSPMPGRIVSVSVAPGDRVEAGQLLLVIEAMKMQNELYSDAAGTIENVLVAAGDTVERGAALIRFAS